MVERAFSKDVIIGMIFRYLYATSQLENYLNKHLTILLSMDNSNIIYLSTARLLFAL